MDAKAKHDKLIQSTFYKLGQLILQARVPFPSNPDKKKVNSLYLEIEEIDQITHDLHTWPGNLQVPLYLDVYFTPPSPPTSAHPPSPLLERWKVSFDNVLNKQNVEVPLTYKHVVLLLRSVVCMLRVLPAYRVFRNCQKAFLNQERERARGGGGVWMGGVNSSGGSSNSSSSGSSSSGHGGYGGYGRGIGEVRYGVHPHFPSSRGFTSSSPTEDFVFDPVISSFGALSVSVMYKTDCSLEVSTSEPLINAQIIKDYTPGDLSISPPKTPFPMPMPIPTVPAPRSAPIGIPDNEPGGNGLAVSSPQTGSVSPTAVPRSPSGDFLSVSPPKTDPLALTPTSSEEYTPGDFLSTTPPKPDIAIPTITVAAPAGTSPVGFPGKGAELVPAHAIIASPPSSLAYMYERPNFPSPPQQPFQQLQQPQQPHLQQREAFQPPPYPYPTSLSQGQQPLMRPFSLPTPPLSIPGHSPLSSSPTKYTSPPFAITSSSPTTHAMGIGGSGGVDMNVVTGNTSNAVGNALARARTRAASFAPTSTTTTTTTTGNILSSSPAFVNPYFAIPTNAPPQPHPFPYPPGYVYGSSPSGAPSAAVLSGSPSRSSSSSPPSASTSPSPPPSLLPGLMSKGASSSSLHMSALLGPSVYRSPTESRTTSDEQLPFDFSAGSPEGELGELVAATKRAPPLHMYGPHREAKTVGSSFLFADNVDKSFISNKLTNFSLND